jgi:hypothetical protein
MFLHWEFTTNSFNPFRCIFVIEHANKIIRHTHETLITSEARQFSYTPIALGIALRIDARGLGSIEVLSISRRNGRKGNVFYHVQYASLINTSLYEQLNFTKQIPVQH